jgi:hypothetical protein
LTIPRKASMAFPRVGVKTPSSYIVSTSIVMTLSSRRD